MVRLKISNRSSVQLAAIVVAAAGAAAVRGQPLRAMPFVLGAIVAIAGVQLMGEAYDRPQPWWALLVVMALSIFLVWRM